MQRKAMCRYLKRRVISVCLAGLLAIPGSISANTTPLTHHLVISHMKSSDSDIVKQVNRLHLYGRMSGKVQKATFPENWQSLITSDKTVIRNLTESNIPSSRRSEKTRPDGKEETTTDEKSGPKDFALRKRESGKISWDNISLINNVIQHVILLNAKQGIVSQFDSKLVTATRAFEYMKEQDTITAIDTLHAFIHSVRTQIGNEISMDDAYPLIITARMIIADVEK